MENNVDTSSLNTLAHGAMQWAAEWNAADGPGIPTRESAPRPGIPPQGSAYDAREPGIPTRESATRTPRAKSRAAAVRGEQVAGYGQSA